MGYEQIIKKVIKKVEKNGFDLVRWYCKECNLNNSYYTPLKSEALQFVLSHKFMQRDLFFNNDFAKAYWGEKYTRCGSCLSKIYDYEITHCTNPKCNIPLLPEYTDEMYGWREHQHQMLTEVQEGKCPLQYLEKFL